MSKKTPPRGQIPLLPPAADQLSWLDIVEPAQVAQDGEDLSYTDADFIPSAIPHMPEYIVVERRWADGDTSPEALERLSHVHVGDTGIFKDNKKDVYKYVSISTAVIGKRVWIAYQFSKKLGCYNSEDAEQDE